MTGLSQLLAQVTELRKRIVELERVLTREVGPEKVRRREYMRPGIEPPKEAA